MKILENYPNLQKFLEKYNVAVKTMNRDVRFTISELADIHKDICSLIADSNTKNISNENLQRSINELILELKKLEDISADGGKF